MMKMRMIVGLGSFAGGVLRFLLARFVQVNSASSFPWGTAAVNLLGCFILGSLYGLFDRSLVHTETRLWPGLSGRPVKKKHGNSALRMASRAVLQGNC